MRARVAVVVAGLVAGLALVGSPPAASSLPDRTGTDTPLRVRLACNGLAVGGTPREVVEWMANQYGIDPRLGRLTVSLIGSGHRSCT